MGNLVLKGRIETEKVMPLEMSVNCKATVEGRKDSQEENQCQNLGEMRAFISSKGQSEDMQ